MFQQIKVKARGLIFIKFDANKFKDINISHFVQPVIDEVWQDNQTVTKDIQKMIPIQLAGAPSVENFDQALERLVKDNTELIQDLKTWCLVFKQRNNNNKFNKLSFLEISKSKLSQLNQRDYNGDLTVFLDITNNLMCINIFKNFEKHKRFQLIRTNPTSD